MTVNDSSLAGNSAEFGGAIFTQYIATVTGSTLSDNTATIDGGAIYNDGVTLYVGTSDFSGNTPDDIVGGYIDLGGNSPIVT